MSAPPTTIVVQAMGNQHMRFDVGRAALQVSNAVQAAPLWLADLRMTAGAAAAAAVATLVVAAYTIATGGEHAWAPGMAQTPLVLLAAGWWLISAGRVWRAQRALAALLAASVFGTVAMAALFFWWVAARHASVTDALWWTLLALLLFELLCVGGGAMALANLLDCRHICDSHHCFRAVLTERAATQIVRGDAGDGHKEPRLGSGALALHDAGPAAAAATTTAAKKRE
jgi:hypothetical protein